MAVEDGEPKTKKNMTIDEAVAAVGGGSVQKNLFGLAPAETKLFCLTGLTYLSDVAEIMFLGFATQQLQCQWHLSSAQMAYLPSVVFVGMMMGALVWGRIADVWGRRFAFLGSTAMIAFFGSLTAVVGNFWWLLLTRSFTGFGVAGCSVAFDVLAEFCDEETRGKRTMTFNLWWSLGSVYVNVSAFFLLQFTFGWRLLALVVSIPPWFSLFLACYYLPESPRWLLCQGRMPEAVDVVNDWARENGLADEPITALECDDEECEASFQDMVLDESIRKDMALMALIWFCFGLFYWGIMLLVPQYFEEKTEKCKLNLKLPNSLCTCAAEALGVIVVVKAFDNEVGRKPVQAVGYFTCGVAGIVLLSLPTPTTIFQSMLLTAVASVVRTSIFAASCCTWVHTPELFPTQYRTTAHGILNMMCRIGGFVAPYVILNDQTRPTIMISVMFLAGGLSLGLRETGGKSCSEILAKLLPRRGGGSGSSCSIGDEVSYCEVQRSQ